MKNAPQGFEGVPPHLLNQWLAIRPRTEEGIPDGFVTVHQLARIWNVSTATVRRQVSRMSVEERVVIVRSPKGRRTRTVAYKLLAPKQ